MVTELVDRDLRDRKSHTEGLDWVLFRYTGATSETFTSPTKPKYY